MKNILIIDDDVIIQKILFKILDQSGYNVVVGTDGRDGLSKIEHMKFDLIITDLMMPYLNGFELMDEFKNHSNTLNAKFVVISSIAEDASIMSSLDAHEHHFIPKPIIIDQFLKKIKDLLN